MNFRIAGDCVEPGPLTERDLRLENLRLREKLKAANAAATNHALQLREGSHRIKNSLQIVSSLLSLQAGREQDAAAREALHAAAARIQSVSHMHDALQASGSDDNVDLGAALETMCKALQTMGGGESGVDVRVDADLVETPFAFAQSISLAVNELVVNALRHAFPDGRAGSVLVELRRTGDQLHVLVADDGVGLPTGYFEGRGFGMKLVKMMVDKVKGELSIGGGPGTRISILSPRPQNDAAARPSSTQAIAAVSISTSTSVVSRDPIGLLQRKPWMATGRG